MKILQVIREIYYGLKYGYPRCCIWQYVKTSYYNGFPANEGWDRFHMDEEESVEEAELFKHVQCDKCLSKYLERIRI